jgi:polyribonucleotide nucleotidyltransferase
MVAGVAMGLILEPDGQFVVLTDILGSEDALGDMDFKVAGDESGITAFQMDIKVEGITLDIMERALEAAGEGRRRILGEMERCDPPPRRDLAPHAPRIRSVMVPVEKLGVVIGTGGRTVRSIQELTGVELQVEQTGEVRLKGPSEAALDAAALMVDSLVCDPAPGRVYRNARVVQVMPFGAFVELAPKRDGLLHVSEWDGTRTPNIADVVKEGDLVDVMVLQVEEKNGKIKLSRKAVLVLDGKIPPPPPPPPPSEDDGASGSSGEGEAPKSRAPRPKPQRPKSE